MAKIIYFTAGPKPTTGEQDEIDDILALPGNELVVRNAANSAEWGGSDDSLEDADYVAGTPPTGTDYDDTNVYPVFTVGDQVTPSLVQEGDTIVLTDGAGTTLNCTLVVTNGVPTLTCAATAKIIKDGVEFLSPAVSGSRTDGYTPTIAAGVVTALAGS